MNSPLHVSMNELHTWAGVILGGVLFAIFWMGTLSVFDREIDRWMMPMTRVVGGDAAASIDVVARTASLLASESKASQWTILLPNRRVPVAQIVLRDSRTGAYRLTFADAVTGRIVEDRRTLGASGFFFPFHYNLHIKLLNLGYWIVGLAGMGFLALIVSGVIIHRRILANFFLLRLSSKTQRMTLDLHNIAGVLGLPFHVAITLSGLVIFSSIYWPTAFAAYENGDQAQFFRETFGIYSRPASGIAGAESQSIDKTAREAVRLWGQGRAYFIRLWYPGDRASYIEVRRAFEDDVTMNADVAYFDAATGTLLHSHTASPLITTQRFISGLHFIQFDHWALRWTYFVLGLLGCVLIATGYLFWLKSRRKRREACRTAGFRAVEGLALGSTVGIVVATLAFFTANRLLPAETTALAADRATVEVWAFYLVWVATFAHGWLRAQRAWIEQCSAIACLSVIALLSNWITTGDHVLRSLAYPHLWPVGGMDVMLIAAGIIAALAAAKLEQIAAIGSAQSGRGQVAGSRVTK